MLANGQEGKVIQSDQSDRRNCAAAIEMVEHGRPTEVLFFATLLLSYSISIGHSNDLMFVGSVAGSVLQTEHKFKPLSLFYRTPFPWTWTIPDQTVPCVKCAVC